MSTNLCSDATDLLDLFMNGIDASYGDRDVFEKAVGLFSESVSDDIEECIQHAISHKVAVWDFYAQDQSEWGTQINDLWVSYVIKQANLSK